MKISKNLSKKHRLENYFFLGGVGWKPTTPGAREFKTSKQPSQFLDWKDTGYHKESCPQRI